VVVAGSPDLLLLRPPGSAIAIPDYGIGGRC
jgi:hypothetical protein